MSYRAKLRLMIVALLALSIGLSGAWLISASFDSALTREVEAAQTEERMALYTLAAASGGRVNDGTEELYEAIRTLERQTGLSYRLVAANGSLLYQSGSGFADGLADAVSDTAMAWRICLDEKGEHQLQIAGVLTGADGGTIRLETLRPIEEIYRARNELSRSFCGLLAAAAAVGTAAAWVLSRWLTGSLTALTGTARAIAAGDLGQRADARGSDEIGQLARDFNAMADQLCQNIEALEGEMAKREEFMAAFAHEMRTPMTSIIGYADLLRSQELGRDARAEAANYIFTEGRRLENLSNKLLDLIVLGKREADLRPCHMGRLIAQTGGLFDRTLRQAGIALRCRVDETVWPVEPDLFSTLLVNLIDNARKAMPEGGVIALRAGMDGADWKLTVRDTGQGIPAAELPRLTEAFYRVDKARARASGGVGLGLRLCAEIAHVHGGTISFESTEGEGTTVTVVLKGGTRP